MRGGQEKSPCFGLMALSSTASEEKPLLVGEISVIHSKSGGRNPDSGLCLSISPEGVGWH